MTGRALDAPGLRCAFASHHCTHLAEGAGGFDEHHRDPVELGGDPRQRLLPLCPLHHRRQHALIRYLVECDEARKEPAHTVLIRFTIAEREAAAYALEQWTGRGRPVIKGWPCPAARAIA